MCQELSNPWQSGAIRTAIDGCSGFELASEMCDCRLSYSLRLGQSCVADESGGLQVVALETAIDTGNAKVWEVDGAEVHGDRAKMTAAFAALLVRLAPRQRLPRG